jgi:fatty acid desaturase
MQIFYIDDIIGFLMPPLMFITKIVYTSIVGTFEPTLVNVLIIAFEAGLFGNLVLIAASVTFNVIGLNVGHHGTDVTHEGDEFKSLDFGVYQMAATIDRTGANANLFMALTHYGEHIVHHMMPSVDHSVLHLFWDILEETCKEFAADLRLIPIKKAALMQFQQLGRTEVNRLDVVVEIQK